MTLELTGGGDGMRSSHLLIEDDHLSSEVGLDRQEQNAVIVIEAEEEVQTGILIRSV